MRDHLFISYATEDWPFAEWLCRKLTVEGYKVWCDRFKLLGGESYPRDIDAALKTQTFRLLSVLSRSSINKSNPVKERTMGLNLGKELDMPDFLVPLNLDGLRPSDLDWMTSDITFIPFFNGWGNGFKQLLEKLHSINAPCPLDQGKSIAISTLVPDRVLLNNDELIGSNLLRVLIIPKTIKKITLKWAALKNERFLARKNWPHWFFSEDIFLSFWTPPTGLFDKEKIRSIEELNIDGALTTCGILTQDIVSSLLYKVMTLKSIQRGLLATPDKKAYYFPANVVSGNKLWFSSYNGKSAWTLSMGQRSYRRLGVVDKFNYHLAVKFRVRRDIPGALYVQLTPSIYFSDISGESLSPRATASRRKQMSRGWHNHEWYNRLLALCYFLSEGGSEIVYGSGAEAICISSAPFTVRSPISIDEKVIEERSPYSTLAESDEEDEEEGIVVGAEDKEDSDV